MDAWIHYDRGDNAFGGFGTFYVRRPLTSGSWVLFAKAVVLNASDYTTPFQVCGLLQILVDGEPMAQEVDQQVWRVPGNVAVPITLNTGANVGAGAEVLLSIYGQYYTGDWLWVSQIVLTAIPVEGVKVTVNGDTDPALFPLGGWLPDQDVTARVHLPQV